MYAIYHTLTYIGNQEITYVYEESDQEALWKKKINLRK